MADLPFVALTSMLTEATGLRLLDWIVIGTYAAGMLLLGVAIARQQKTTRDYFLASGRMSSSLVGISIAATFISTLSYLTIPGEMIGRGPVYLWALLSVPFYYLIVGYVLIPAIMKRQVTSAYEIVEPKLGLSGRLFAATIFILMRLIWMGLMVHVAAETMVLILGLEPSSRFGIILITGAIAVGYTALGGLRAVIITDAIQFFLLLGGALLTIAMVSANMDGWDWWPTSWSPRWDEQPWFSWDPYVRATTVGSIVSFATFWICNAGSDQVTIQRFMATGTPHAARRAYLINVIASTLVTVVLAITGFAVLGFFTNHPELLPKNFDWSNQSDDLFPRFVTHHLPAGCSGLVVSAMFAAVMSSLDSGINSVSAVILVDFVGRCFGVQLNPRNELRMARCLTVVVGIGIVLAAILVAETPGNILAVTNKTANLLAPPLFVLLFLALAVPFATPFGSIFGATYGITIGSLIAFWDVITGSPSISFQWIGITSLIVGVASGVLLSLLPTRGRSVAALASYSAAALLPIIASIGWALAVRLSAA